MVIDKFCADGKDTPAFGSFQSMFNYYDACENGLARADPGLKAQPQRSFFSWRYYVGYEPISLRVPDSILCRLRWVLMTCVRCFGSDWRADNALRRPASSPGRGR